MRTGGVVFFFQSCDVVREVPIWVGSPDRGSHKGGSLGHPQPMANTRVWEPPHTQRSLSSLSFLHHFLLVFLNFPDLSPSSLCFWIFLICPIKNCSMRTWEHRNIARSPPLHNSLVIFCWGRLYHTSGFRTKTMYDYYIVMVSMFLVVKLSSHPTIGYVSLIILLPWTTHKHHQNYSKTKSFSKIKTLILTNLLFIP